MAAPMRKTLPKYIFWKRFSVYTNFEGFAPVLCLRKSYSSSSNESEIPDLDIEAEVNKLRDVSRLSPYQKEIMTGMTFDMDNFRQNRPNRRAYLRKMYAKYGQKSGVDPSILWPSEEELKDLEYIDKNYTTSFHELKSKLQENKEKQIRDIEEREKTVEKAMEKMPELIAKFKEQEKKAGQFKEQDLDQQDAIRDQFIEYFGYEPINDQRFREFKTFKNFEFNQQKKKEKKEKREKKKEELQTTEN